MAIANIIAQGIGFSPGSVKFIPTFGFVSGDEPVVDPTTRGGLYADRKTARRRSKQERDRVEAERLAEEDLLSDILDAKDPSRITAREEAARLAEEAEQPAEISDIPIFADGVLGSAQLAAPGLMEIAEVVLAQREAQAARKRKDDRDLAAVLLMM